MSIRLKPLLRAHDEVRGRVGKNNGALSEEISDGRPGFP
jgi:hypothetical protein